MAMTYKVVQEVQPGVLSEYYGECTISANDDALLMSFEGEVKVTDLLISLPGATVATYDIYIHYPSSGFKAKINSSVLSAYEWSLNGNKGQSGNMWYSLPSGGAIEVKFPAVSTGGPVEVLILGR